MFEKFFSTARPDSGKKGTGLGLAFVKEVAALHGGTARLANHPEGGAVATLLLPPLFLHFALVFPERSGAWVRRPGAAWGVARPPIS